jgi:hypothetical protein
LFRYVPFLSQSDGTAPDPIPEQQQRKLVANMFPDAWVEKMEDANIIPANTDMGRILEYMNKQWKHEVNRSSGQKRSSGSSHYDNGRESSRSRGGNSRGNSYCGGG